MNELITQTLIPFGGSMLGGVFMGYALKKILKWIVIIGGTIVGAFLFGILVLQSYGYISRINWDKIGNDLGATFQSWIVAVNTNGTPIYGIMHSLGLPITGGLAAGMIIGFMKG